MTHKTTLIHPMSLVSDSDIGSHVKIWQFASVIRGAMVGNGTQIGSGALVDGAYIGKESLVGPNSSIFPGAWVGDQCFIGPNVVFCNDNWPRANKQGFSGFIPAMAWGDNGQRMDNAAVVVDDGASIGAGAVLLPGIIIGKDAMVAAGATATVNVPNRCLLHRNGRIVPITDDLETARVWSRSRHAIRIKPPMEG